MHRIDGPGATVDNKFTDGDPVVGVPATIVTDDWANDVQEELMSVLAAAGIAPVKGTQDQLLKSIRTLSGGVVGSNRNVKMSITSASSSALLSADQLFVSTSLAGQSYRLSGFNKTINLATTGAGGMDTGTAPVSGYVALYAIYNPVTGVTALLATNATAAAAPEVYGGANMPAGYTASALITVLPTNASSQFGISYVSGRKVTVNDVAALNTTAGVTLLLLSIASSVPKNAIRVSGSFAAAATAGSGGVSLVISGFASGLGAKPLAGYSTSPNGCSIPFQDLPLATAQSIWYTTALAGPGTGVFTVTVKEYEI